jgi:MFS family permease
VFSSIALGAGTLLLARDLTVFVLGAFLSTVAIRVFWAAFAPLVGDAVPAEEREKWFGLLRGSRYAGTAAGGLLASAVLLLGQQQGLLTMVAVDGASYLLAAALIAGARIAPRENRPAPGAPTPSYRVAMRDRTNLALITLNVAATLLISAPAIAMPIYVLSVLHQPAWLPGVLAGTGTVALAIGVTLVHRVTAHRGRLRVLAGAGVVWTVGALAYALAPVTNADLTLGLLFVAVIAIGLGEALHGPTADTLPLVIAPPGMAGRYTALHQVAWGISGSLTPALVGTLMSGSPQLLWLVLGVLGATTAATYWLLPAAAHARASTVGSTGSSPVLPAPVELPADCTIRAGLSAVGSERAG